MTTTFKPVTAEELFVMRDDGFRYELVRGELRRYPLAGAEHGITCINVIMKLCSHIKSHGQGVGLGTGTGFQLESEPDTVRAADVAFIRRERITESGVPEFYWQGAPDLAVEVVAPEDTFEEVEEKVDAWLGAGARAVWVVNPSRRGVSVYHSSKNATRLSEGDELDGGEVVPGFRCKVAEIFDEPF